ncbi:hypothetical protein DAPPUDRAFT_112245 [Daphnia pulex]|uniref:CUB domain-containing protein n=1 Tax=Daphnia pulex TaxID=6669 RepID=E9HBD6_DAPPU|nr:hypothetical protein DAPPUDRAFT_112245 [Daphnia pulex]|eukprot:EFX70962.1 hypothetical protein DAPPUDRAFT_112245 [Daphnia pulex]
MPQHGSVQVKKVLCTANLRLPQFVVACVLSLMYNGKIEYGQGCLINLISPSSFWLFATDLDKVCCRNSRRKGSSISIIVEVFMSQVVPNFLKLYEVPLPAGEVWGIYRTRQSVFDESETTTGLSLEMVSTVESTYVNFGGPASCRSDCSEERGNCLDPGMCSMAGGRASEYCANGFVCCVNKDSGLVFLIVGILINYFSLSKGVVNTCHSHHGAWSGDSLVILNNTYWQSPLRPIEPSSSCTLTVKFDSRYPDLYNPVSNPLTIPYPQKPIC